MSSQDYSGGCGGGSQKTTQVFANPQYGVCRSSDQGRLKKMTLLRKRILHPDYLQQNKTKQDDTFLLHIPIFSEQE